MGAAVHVPARTSRARASRTCTSLSACQAFARHVKDFPTISFVIFRAGPNGVGLCREPAIATQTAFALLAPPRVACLSRAKRHLPHRQAVGNQPCRRCAPMRSTTWGDSSVTPPSAAFSAYSGRHLPVGAGARSHWCRSRRIHGRNGPHAHGHPPSQHTFKASPQRSRAQSGGRDRPRCANAARFCSAWLTGLMPCGPLQAMQVYAVATGSAAAGALSLFAFCLGTVPLMFVAGSAIAALKTRWRRGLSASAGQCLSCLA